MSALRRLLAILLVAVMACLPVRAGFSGAALAQDQDSIAPDDMRLELVLEERAHAPHPGEMILLSIHGTFKIPVVRENLRQPDLEGFDWMQLGEDRWYKAREDGFEVLKFERRMALFPQRSGAIPIAPFVHALEMLDRQGRTVAIDEVSNAVTVTAAPMPDAQDWWFPVRALEISDAWSNQPEALDPGSAALRIVALTVMGTAPQRIPPMPELTGAGAHIFAHPEHKIVALGPDGPVTRVFWRWTVRPQEGSAGYLNPVDLVYFDTEARARKTITLAAQRVAHTGGATAIRPGATEPGRDMDVAGPVAGAGVALPGWAVPLAGLAGAIAGLGWSVWAWGQAGMRLPGWLRADADRRGLRIAVRRGDQAGVRRHARAVAGHQTAGLARLEAALFGAGGMPDLRAVAREARRAARDTGRSASGH